MQENEEPEKEAYFTYGRPSMSAWIAGVAVACSFFLLGGFIKTFFQLEDSRRSIALLKERVHKLETQLEAPKSGQQQRRPRSRRDRSPPLAVNPGLRPPAPAYDAGPRVDWRDDEPADPEPRAGALATLPEFPESRPGKISVSFGNTSGDGSALSPLIRGECKVVAVDRRTDREYVTIDCGYDDFESLGKDRNNRRLELSRDGAYIAEVNVLEVFAKQAVCEVVFKKNDQGPLPDDTVRVPYRTFQ